MLCWLMAWQLAWARFWRRKRDAGNIAHTLSICRLTKNIIRLAVGLLEVVDSVGGLTSAPTNTFSDIMWLVVVLLPLLVFNCTSTLHSWHGACEFWRRSSAQTTAPAVILFFRWRPPVTSCCQWCSLSMGWFLGQVANYRVITGNYWYFFLLLTWIR